MPGETGKEVSGWTIDTLHYYFEKQLSDLEKHLEERHTNQQLLVEKAFASSERAVRLRADQAEKEFHEHIDQVRHENALAFKNSDLAISKAESANEKRFDSVNAFRGQLSDQAATFMNRSEADAAIGRQAERVQELTDRFNKLEGRGVGLNGAWIYALGAIAALGTLISLVIAFQK